MDNQQTGYTPHIFQPPLGFLPKHIVVSHNCWLLSLKHLHIQIMEVTSQNFTSTKFAFFHYIPSAHGSSCVSFSGFKTSQSQSPRKLQHFLHLNAGPRRKLSVIQASTEETTSTYDGERWLLQPVGNKHPIITHRADVRRGPGIRVSLFYFIFTFFHHS